MNLWEVLDQSQVVDQCISQCPIDYRRKLGTLEREKGTLKVETLLHAIAP